MSEAPFPCRYLIEQRARYSFPRVRGFCCNARDVPESPNPYVGYTYDQLYQIAKATVTLDIGAEWEAVDPVLNANFAKRHARSDGRETRDLYSTSTERS
jgi:hypothetical protein